jgi:predicted aconitase with swiveling domain
VSESYRSLVPGSVEAEMLVLDGPLSLWGGLDPETGRIIDRSHPQHGKSMTGVIVAMPHGRGSSSSSSVLAEAIRLGTAPAGFVLSQPDGILVIGSLVAKHLYHVSCPILCGPSPSPRAGVWQIDDNLLRPPASNGPVSTESGGG